MYAAGCGCHVYIFEVQPKMCDIIKTSIAINNFSSSRVHLIHRAVSTLPSNSTVTFLEAEGDTKAANGSLQVSTIRLDDADWPANSTIFLLKIDVEGSELSVLRSAEKMFKEKRIRHLIFEYTAYWDDRSDQRSVLAYVQNTLGSKKLYALDRAKRYVYGPLDFRAFESFHEIHVKKRLQTDIYAIFSDSNTSTHIKSKRYNPISSNA